MSIHQWRFEFVLSLARMTYRNILRGLYSPAKKLQDLVEKLQMEDKLREFDTYRDNERYFYVSRYGEADPRNMSKPGMDAFGIPSGFIKVDGVWRDLQYYISFQRQYTRTRRTFAADYIPSAYHKPGNNPVSTQVTAIRHATQSQDSFMHTGVRMLPYDRPFSEWDE